MKIAYLFILCIILQACHSRDSVLIVQESCTKDSIPKGETFNTTYLKLLFPARDTLLSRIAFPLKVTYKLNGKDWATENISSMQAFQKSDLFNKIIKALRETVPYDETYKFIFADPSSQNQQLKIIQKEKDLGFRFVSKNGHWLLAEYAESLIEF